MAVHKRSYRTWAGELTPQWSRWFVITKFALRELLAVRFLVVMLVLGFVPLLVEIGIVYLANMTAARALLHINNQEIIDINSEFFLRCLQVQVWITVMFTAWAGPVLVAGDLAHNALSLYLSRPITRSEYVLGKAGVLVLFLSAFTWVQGLILFVIQVSLAPIGWLGKNYWVAGSILLASAIWIAFLSLFALALSSWVKWRIVASALTLAVFPLPTGFGAVINAILRTGWGNAFNIVYMVSVVWFDLFRVPLLWRMGPFQREPFPTSVAWLVLLSLCVLSLYMLNKRIRAREVVR